ncbi:tRNA wybutosine-synthesizing protein 3 homolog isoform X1 [Peromyscus californicus insignis]|uniref:tRNA wybutosine-synthesizing protein 3 homolog isoform X1 n=1 Tax=Peromyscus californicus insignis TaxID=564181 RepID=UPI0022A804DD|nr:tRNA wybutosine-synthesizing protein 3 homolog isoform X1 [Peromyscus californicus insignis]
MAAPTGKGDGFRRREPGPYRSRMDRSAEFRRWKAQSLSKADLSRKGSVDEDAAEVVELLNAREEFFTTSSCAGRILLLDGSTDGSGVQKQHCCWMLVTHKPCGKDDVMAALKGATSNAVLKFEPFILHVQCRTLQDAQTLHSVAIDSGFRNSGITVGKRGKTMLAVRSTHGLEVPLSRQGKLMVTEEYIEFLVTIANQKMEENKKRIGRFYNCLQHAMERKTISNSHSEIKEKNNPFCTHKNKRSQGKARDPSVTEGNETELEGADGLGISAPFFLEDD